MLDVGGQIVYASVLITLLARGSGIYALLLASSVGAVSGGLVTALFYRQRLGRLFANPFAIERGLLRQVLNFSGWTQLSFLFNFLVLETDPFVLGAFVSIADVGIYSLAGTPRGTGQSPSPDPTERPYGRERPTPTHAAICRLCTKR